MIHKTADNSRSIRIAEWCCTLAVFLAVVMPRASTIWILGLIICYFFHRRLFWHPMLWPFLALGIWSMISTTVQIEYKDRWSSHDFTFLYNWLPLLFVPALPWAEIKRREWLARLLFIGICIAGFIILLQGFLNFDFYNEKSFNLNSLGKGAFFTGLRPQSTWDHPLKFGAVITLTSLAHMTITKSQLNSSNLPRFIVLTTWGISLFLNKTRLAILSFLAILPLCLIKKWSFKTLSLALLSSFLLIGAIGSIAYQVDGFRVKIDNMINLEDGRFNVWQHSLNLYKEEPVMGYGGIKHFRNAYRDNANSNQILGTKGTHAHNSYLAIACSYGFVGLILWLTAHVWLFKYCWKLECKTAIIVLLCYHSMGFLEDMAEERYLTCLCMFLVSIDIAWNLHPSTRPKSKSISDKESATPAIDS